VKDVNGGFICATCYDSAFGDGIAGAARQQSPMMLDVGLYTASETMRSVKLALEEYSWFKTKAKGRWVIKMLAEGIDKIQHLLKEAVG